MAYNSNNKNNIVVVFDFDKTIIDVDSDNWVVDGLGFTDLFNQLLPTMPWNTLMDRMMKELHDQGKTIEEIKEVLKTIPIHPRVVPAIKSAHALGCELRIVSDANMFFIETIVEHLGISEYFSEINSNPGFVDEHDTLRISPYHDFTNSSHGCSHRTCPPNMCKGLIIERIQESLAKEGKKKMIYLGDGAGDYCPTLKLKSEDYAMPRKNFPVWDLISQNPMLVKSAIREWTDGESLERILIGTIEEILLEEENEKKMLTNAENNCKMQNISVGINVHHEPIMPRALRVSQSG
ncbi:Inorganic pyrophosphatase 1 [Raphanus sativus]|uniref:Inorganic pyrophosphatase 1 n=1 Tax=Raphanus sativus TaxID=3726 RepID=A0A6J0LWN2_RAPSA|nr:inorganic pyrophosphatase 1 [Raphanus sativus]KAJ4909401.1 Inorganic pyrophosphatase 1 [Raphanus sativus]